MPKVRTVIIVIEIWIKFKQRYKFIAKLQFGKKEWFPLGYELFLLMVYWETEIQTLILKFWNNMLLYTSISKEIESLAFFVISKIWKVLENLSSMFSFERFVD